MSKEKYNYLLKIRDEIYNYGQLEPPEDGVPPPIVELDPLPKYPFVPVFEELNIILESKICQDSQIKGSQLSGYAKRYRSYQINDLEKFIYLICKEIHQFWPVDIGDHERYALVNLLKAIENANSYIRNLFGKRENNQINELGNKLRTYLSKESSSQVIFPSERYLSNYITDLFKKHIPDVPEQTISARVSELLELFGIKLKPKTITQRELRKRKALPEI